MIPLILYIGLTVLIGLIFKTWNKVGIHVLPGILHNYIACLALSLMFHGSIPSVRELVQKPWWPFAIGLSVAFVGGFYVYAIALTRAPVGTVTAVQKMSMFLSVIFSIVFLGTSPRDTEWVGIIVGAIALPFLAHNPRTINTSAETPLLRQGSAVIWLLLTFLLSGAVETGLALVELRYTESSADPLFIGTIFLFSFIIGFSAMVCNSSLRIHFLSVRHLVAGIALGIPNYLSIHFLMKSLGSDLPTHLVMPAANVGTILVSLIAAYKLYNEKMHLRQAIGIAMAFLSLILLTLDKMP